MKVIIEIPDKDIPETQDILSVDLSFVSGRIGQCTYPFEIIKQEPTEVLDKIRAEIDRQHKWLLQAGYTAYNVDIAFDTIKAVMAESEDEEC